MSVLKIKYISLSFMAVFAMLQTNPASADYDLDQEHSSLCPIKTIELFSCRLKSEASVALCVGKEDLKIKFAITNPKGNKNYIIAENLKQLSSDSSSGPSQILQGNTKSGSITLFLDQSTAEPIQSAIKIDNKDNKEVDFCISSTIRTPSPKWSGPNNNWVGRAGVYGLTFMGLAKSFGLNTNEEFDLWRTWPKEKH